MSKRPTDSAVNLQQAVTLLIENQASFVREMAESNRRHDEMKLQSDRRFATIERELGEIRRLLFELPETIRQKIGFKSK